MSLMSVKDLFDLTGRVALVTGGSRGLGLDMAIGLGEAGAAVMITARREQWLTTAEAELLKRGVSCATAVCDVSNPAQVEATVKATLDAFGRLDVVVNNAGISWGEPIETMPVERWRQVMETNATGCFLVSQAAGRELVRAGRGGSIINIASVAGLGGLTADVLDAVGYSASKGAIVALTKDLAVKWAPHDIRVNAIAPGFFDTRLSHSLLEKTQARVEKTTPMGRIGKPGELSGVAVFLASAASSYITGQVLAVDGGMTA
jgi:NAD(P)-dependent dehydrogenase (short-subunit alcohol dehydrogenase family)